MKEWVSNGPSGGLNKKGTFGSQVTTIVVLVFSVNTLFEGVYIPSRYLEVSSEQYNFFLFSFLWHLDIDQDNIRFKMYLSFSNTDSFFLMKCNCVN